MEQMRPFPFLGKLLLSVLAGVAIFSFLMVLGEKEGWPGIGKETSPTFAIVGSAVIGLLSYPRFESRGKAAVLRIAFLATGSLVVYLASGGKYIFNIYHPTLEWWEAAISVFGPFGLGLVARAIVKAT